MQKSDLYSWVKVATKTFSKKKYLEAQNEADLEFYKQVRELQYGKEQIIPFLGRDKENRLQTLSVNLVPNSNS